MSLSAQSSSGVQFDALNSAPVVERTDVADLVFRVSKHSILTLGGINVWELRTLLENVEPFQEMPRALSVVINSASSAEAIIDEIIRYLAETALRLWPMWYHGSGAKFEICGNDSLGRQAARVLANEAGRKIAGTLPLWLRCSNK